MLSTTVDPEVVIVLSILRLRSSLGDRGDRGAQLRHHVDGAMAMLGNDHTATHHDVVHISWCRSVDCGGQRVTLRHSRGANTIGRDRDQIGKCANLDSSGVVPSERRVTFGGRRPE